MDTTKPTNPKDCLGSLKVPMHLWPNTATVMGAMGLLDGACKYGRSNFRAIGVRSSVYYDAARRHLDRWFEGEDIDPDSGLPHMAHALASIAIIVDAQAAGKLNDDRMIAGGFHEMLEQMTPHVGRIKEKYADKSPRHYTIADSAFAEHAAREEDARLVEEANQAADDLTINGWFPHDVSGRPNGLGDDVMVEVLLRGGDRGKDLAGKLDWDNGFHPSDIIFWCYA